MEYLEEILERIKELGGYGRDKESDHMAADGILIEVIRALTSKSSSSIKAKCEEIIEIFNELPKWYS